VQLDGVARDADRAIGDVRLRDRRRVRGALGQMIDACAANKSSPRVGSSSVTALAS
jgi:hypothetical protein